MALALRSVAPLSPEVILAQSISEFEQALAPEQKAAFRALRSQALQTAPQPHDVMRFTAELSVRVKGRSAARCLGPRFTSVLQTAQQYAALGDVIVGASQNILAAGIWSLVRLSLQVVVGLTSFLERISIFFMEVGRSSPRYQSMALLYPRSASLRGSLCHYFSVVTKVCHHFVSFGQKSMLGQLASSLDDSLLRTAQAELDKWARCVVGEVNFLATQTIETEAKENSGFRALFGATRASETHRRRLKRRLKLLDGCSRLDFETPWKQARKLGDSTIFVNNDVYRRWRQGSGPSMLILTGKLGSGKSVTMANMVDDLHLLPDGATTIYFFGRHDRPKEQTARAIIGCLFRQLLQTCIQNTAMDELIDDLNTSPSLEYVAGILAKVLPRERTIYCLIDGLDECPITEALKVMRWIKRLRAELCLYCCLAVRSSAHKGLATEENLGEWTSIEMPDNNPDIIRYINDEMQDCIETGRLKIGDPLIAIEIRDTLLRGANGMFLWVALQIQSLSEEQSDEAIRAALATIPADLHTTFERILTRARSGRKDYQGVILKLVSSALRPLTLDELREAISVTPNDPTWREAQLVNNIREAISCCGSLLVVDEEELSVRLIHNSVLQFLLISNERRESLSPWHFSLEDAHVLMGEVAVTYLNYGIFDKSISTSVAPTVLASQLTENVIKASLKPSGVRRKIALMLLSGVGPAQASNGLDLGRAVADVWSQYNRQREGEVAGFVGYAAQHWLQHTSWIDQSSRIYQLWLAVRQNPMFEGALPWNRDQIHANADELIVHQPDREVQAIAPAIAWAISNDHLALLSAELTGRHWARSFADVMSYLITCCACEMPPVFAPRIATKLCQIAMLFNSARIAERLLSMVPDLTTPHVHQMLSEAVARQAYGVLKALVYSGKYQSKYLNGIILQLAVDAEDAHLVFILLRGQKSDAVNRIFNLDCDLTVVLNNILYNPKGIRIIFNTLGSGFLPPALTAAQFCQLMTTCQTMVHSSQFSLLPEPNASVSRVLPLIKDHLRRNGFIIGKLTTRGFESSAVQTIPFELHPNEWSRVSPMHRCIQLRQWSLAQGLLERGTDNEEALRYISHAPLLHASAYAGDLEGLSFILGYNRGIVNLRLSGKEFFGWDTPIQAALKGECSGVEHLGRRVKAVAYLLNSGANPTLCATGSEPCIDSMLRLCLAVAKHAVCSPKMRVDTISAVAVFAMERILAFYYRIFRDTYCRPTHLHAIVNSYLNLSASAEFLGRRQRSPRRRLKFDLTAYFYDLMRILLRFGGISLEDTVWEKHMFPTDCPIKRLLAGYGAGKLTFFDRIFELQMVVPDALECGNHYVGLIKEVMKDDSLVRLGTADLWQSTINRAQGDCVKIVEAILMNYLELVLDVSWQLNFSRVKKTIEGREPEWMPMLMRAYDAVTARLRLVRLDEEALDKLDRQVV